MKDIINVWTLAILEGILIGIVFVVCIVVAITKKQNTKSYRDKQRELYNKYFVHPDDQ